MEFHLSEKFWFLSLAGIFIVILCMVFQETSLAVEPSTSPHSGPFLDLNIENGNVTGVFKGQPVGEILSRLARKWRFQFQINENLATFPVSGRFDKVSLPDALKQILGPFNYLVLAGSEKQPGTIFILSARSGDPSEGPTPWMQATLPQYSEKQQEGASLLENVEMSDEMREVFNIADKKEGPPSELEYLFNPLPDSGIEFTGPLRPDHSLPEKFPDHLLSLDKVEMSDEARAAFGVADQKKGLPPELMDQFYPKQTLEPFKTGPTLP